MTEETKPSEAKRAVALALWSFYYGVLCWLAGNDYASEHAHHYALDILFVGFPLIILVVVAMAKGLRRWEP